MKIKNLEIGDKIPKICVPILEHTEDEIIKQAREVRNAKPDLIEFRGDFFSDYKEPRKLHSLLLKLRFVIEDIPLLLTIRRSEEGGMSQLTKEEYRGLYQTAILTGVVDMVDYELMFLKGGCEDLIVFAKSQGVRVLVSNHDFEKMPEDETIGNRFKQMKELDADILKVAYMPQSKEDVERFRRCALVASVTCDVPIIAIAMGELGISSRTNPQRFGGSITFGTVKKASAPGQINIETLRKLL